MFITLEGIDGSGKTTAIKGIKKVLEKEGYEVVVTREPGGLPLSEKIRNLILDDKELHSIDGMTEALLFLAARREHLKKLIIPALEQDKIVISDRFIDSTTVYQGYARGLDIELLEKIQNYVIDEKYIPNLTIFFKVNGQKVEKRLKDREYKNRLDLEGNIFKDKVAEGYEKLIIKHKNRFKVVDASLPLLEMQNQVNEIVLKSVHEYNQWKNLK